MLAVLSRLFSGKPKRKRVKNLSVEPSDRENSIDLKRNETQNERVVVHATVEVHDNDERDTAQASTNEDVCFMNEANTRFTSQLHNNGEPEVSILRKKEVLSTSIAHALSRNVIEEIAEFYQRRSYPQTDIRILITKSVIIYVLGTNHANSQCREDVVDIIEKVQPQRVLVELCALRACGCDKHMNNAFQTTPKFTFRYLRAIINQLGFLPAMIFFTDVFREHLVSENSFLHYGGEFIAAMTTAKNVKDCRLVLADRPIGITVKRQASAMGNWRGLRVAFQVTLALLFKNHMRHLMMNANRLIFEDPKTYEVLVFERDLYLTYSIQEAARELENEDGISRVVAVLGQGHVPGIQSYWGKVPSEFIPLIMAPETLLDQ